MTNGDSTTPPSWEQLLTGAHPSFRAGYAAGGGRAPARHGRDGWHPDDEVLDVADLGPWAPDDGMGWGDAVVWTAAAGGVAMLLASRVGGLLH